jgi:hypothetical protein
MFVLFALGVFGVVASLSFAALGWIFPDDLLTQIIGLCLFDLAALVWGLSFVYLSQSIGQYVAAAGGFLVGLAGVIGLVAVEVGISSEQVVVADVVRPLSYIFVGAAAAHLVLLYAHHAAGPEVDSKISLGVEKAKIQAEGMRQAESLLDGLRESLGESIRARLVAEVYADLHLHPLVVDGKLLPVDDSLNIDKNGWPVREVGQEASPFPLNLGGIVNKLRGNRSGSSRSSEPARSAEGATPEASVVEPVVMPADNLPIGDGAKK